MEELYALSLEKEPQAKASLDDAASSLALSQLNAQLGESNDTHEEDLYYEVLSKSLPSDRNDEDDELDNLVAKIQDLKQK